jgi:hypothetical protein
VGEECKESEESERRALCVQAMRANGMQRVETTCGESDTSETAHTKVSVGIEDSEKGEVKKKKRASEKNKQKGLTSQGTEAERK